jgi:phenylpropionate dioxygenase-like ring-hydroxylating dioxygenase large terminal subunit
MFEGFANVWTPVLRAKHLKPGKLLPTVVAGEKVVFFRDEKERVRALLDRCPHRGVQLSLGMVENGCVECPFHAWRFDGQGAVVDVPLNPDAKRERLFATALPAREVGGLLWVYTAPAVPQSNGAEPPGFEPEVPVGLTMKGAARTYLEVEWKTHWTRAMENMLDSPHVPFLHKGTIGRFVKPYLKPGSRMDVEWEDTPYGGRTLSSIDGQAEVLAKHYTQAGEYFGELALLLASPRKATVYAGNSGCVLLYVSKEKFDRVLGPIKHRLKIENYPQYAEIIQQAKEAVDTGPQDDED